MNDDHDFFSMSDFIFPRQPVRNFYAKAMAMGANAFMRRENIDIVLSCDNTGSYLHHSDVAPSHYVRMDRSMSSTNDMTIQLNRYDFLNILINMNLVLHRRLEFPFGVPINMYSDDELAPAAYMFRLITRRHMPVKFRHLRYHVISKHANESAFQGCDKSYVFDLLPHHADPKLNEIIEEEEVSQVLPSNHVVVIRLANVKLKCIEDHPFTHISIPAFNRVKEALGKSQKQIEMWKTGTRKPLAPKRMHIPDQTERDEVIRHAIQERMI